MITLHFKIDRKEDPEDKCKKSNKNGLYIPMQQKHITFLYSDIYFFLIFNSSCRFGDRKFYHCY